MKSKDLVKLGLVGILSATVGCQAPEKEGENGTETEKKESHKAGTMSEEELLMQLDEKGKALYYSMDDEGKALALKLASMTCAGANECAGLNSCKTADNPCAGMGKCKGTGVCGFHDKNVAVKVAAKKMAEKRGDSDY